MKKLIGGAFALLSALVMISSSTPVQAQGLMDSLRNIAGDPSVDNFVRTRFPQYGSMVPNPGYAYGANGYGAGYNNGGLLNNLRGSITGNNYGGNAINPNLMYNAAYGNSQYPNGQAGYGNLMGYGNGQGGGHHRRHHHQCGGGANGANTLSNFNGYGSGFGNGYGNNFNAAYGGPSNGFYSMQNGAPLGGIGYNPYTLGR